MIERDDELNKILGEWKAPQPRSELDARVWRSVRVQTVAPRRRWLPIAAGVALLAGGVSVWLGHSAPPPKNMKLETRAELSGFRPMANGAITVVKPGGKE